MLFAAFMPFLFSLNTLKLTYSTMAYGINKVYFWRVAGRDRAVFIIDSNVLAMSTSGESARNVVMMTIPRTQQPHSLLDPSQPSSMLVNGPGLNPRVLEMVTTYSDGSRISKRRARAIIRNTHIDGLWVEFYNKKIYPRLVGKREDVFSVHHNVE